MFFCRNRQFLQESSIFEMRVVNVFVNRFFSMKWGIFEKMRLFFCFFHSEWRILVIQNGTKWSEDVLLSEAKNLGSIHWIHSLYVTEILRFALNDKNVPLWMTIVWQIKIKTTLFRQPQPLRSGNPDGFLEGTAESVLRIEAALLGNGFEGKALLLFLFEQDLRLLDA